jgi:hypothetical protein
MAKHTEEVVRGLGWTDKQWDHYARSGYREDWIPANGQRVPAPKPEAGQSPRR